MLIRIFDTVFDIRRLFSFSIVGVLNDVQFEMKLDDVTAQQYFIQCVMDDDSRFELYVDNFRYVRIIYDGILYLQGLSDFELRDFIRRISPKEPFSDLAFSFDYDLNNVLYAEIYRKEECNDYFVGVHFLDGSVFFSDEMSYSKCIKYLKNLSLFSVDNKYRNNRYDSHYLVLK